MGQVEVTPGCLIPEDDSGVEPDSGKQGLIALMGRAVI